MSDDIMVVDGKTYTHSTRNRRSLKLKEWGINESVFRSTVGSSGEKVYPGKTFFINTDSLGFIDNENGIESQEKIAILSGSYVECMFMKPKQRLVSHMERRINETRSPVQCLNCSMSGTHILHALFVLLAKIVPIQPALCIYLIDINDFRACRMGNSYYTRHKNLSIFTNDKEEVAETTPNYTYFRKFIRDFWSICKIHGIPCAFFGRTYASDDKRTSANRAAKKVCESLNASYVDIGDAVKEKFHLNKDYDEFITKLTYDKTHLTPYGASVVGDILADEALKLL